MVVKNLLIIILIGITTEAFENAQDLGGYGGYTYFPAGAGFPVTWNSQILKGYPNSPWTTPFGQSYHKSIEPHQSLEFAPQNQGFTSDRAASFRLGQVSAPGLQTTGALWNAREDIAAVAGDNPPLVQDAFVPIAPGTYTPVTDSAFSAMLKSGYRGSWKNYGPNFEYKGLQGKAVDAAAAMTRGEQEKIAAAVAGGDIEKQYTAAEAEVALSGILAKITLGAATAAYDFGRLSALYRKTVLDACFPSPCYSGASCKEVNSNPTCTCPVGCVGVYCETCIGMSKWVQTAS